MAINITKTFSQFKYFWGTWFPGSTNISRSAHHPQELSIYLRYIKGDHRPEFVLNGQLHQGDTL